MIEKLAFGLIITARRLRHYFQGYRIIVRTNQLLRQILTKPDPVGRLTKWSIELSKFDITYQSRGSPKAQALADFVSEFTGETEEAEQWELYKDGASNDNGCGVGILLKYKTGVHAEQSIKFLFQTINNQAEYEALLAGLRHAKEIEVSKLWVYCDSLLVVQQVTGNFQTKDPLLEKYLNLVKNMITDFQTFEIKYIPQEQNCRADILSKFVTYRDDQHSENLVHLTLTKHSLDMQYVLSMTHEQDWRTPIVHYLKTGTIPEWEPRSFKRKAHNFTLIGDNLYRRGFSRPLLRCLEENDAKAAIAEIHEGICGHHVGGRSLAIKILRAGYYWPTIRSNCATKVQQCDALSPGQVKFLLVAVDYFTKWIEAQPLARITSDKALKKNLTKAKGRWAKLIPEILWSYNTTPQTTTKGSPFRLVYGSECMILLELNQGSMRTEHFDGDSNEQTRRVELDLIQKGHYVTELRQKSMQLAMKQQYDKIVRPRTLKEGDLVLIQLEDIQKPPRHGKLATTWEGPFRIAKVIGEGAYCLETLSRTTILNTWNISSLKYYYS
ncbi:uncharacterized protein LOC107633779 [Arachis ipaensis]|nr:uncharacterized protein LOC107633779 [Arachis ipaensis]XP_025640841.1 uncharacterized protein LOC112735522 [Arachis hypogaea]